LQESTEPPKTKPEPPKKRKRKRTGGPVGADQVLLDTRQAARALRISPRLLSAWVRGGHARPTKMGTKRCYTREEIARLAREGGPTVKTRTRTAGAPTTAAESAQ
jgi:MerR HTH family regulatory protein